MGLKWTIESRVTVIRREFACCNTLMSLKGNKEERADYWEVRQAGSKVHQDR